ncbi:Tim10/DDP family zinc finger-domain-containing protein [Kickxella alabastrina]|uniref:Tim10/DDP family zinc finger-domain-containing protein n=1 Tax=Kickxella alabastrina TaxID=61397 RepID=UPI00221E5F1B|nr:Tim10/DDP family zinc finger-domain-containing protein [Kickxella alabastrina]XP_051391776.1 Tim10/DDP family zinc finger-domain-containing protein [Kickxella alabastrina]KAI7819552.1 Tim10/DDP family zinc finger-domain-containing protein [Kickxella alabastrina]KAI7827917.1 Tim10/DDP family zinc finger-domain-containing protein [Kickxella alabastrina]
MSSSFGSNFTSMDLSGSKKEEVKQQVKRELAMANAQELVNNVNKNCFKLCLTNPSTSLSSIDEGCLSRCMDKYLGSWDIVSRAYVARVQQENK